MPRAGYGDIEAAFATADAIVALDRGNRPAQRRTDRNPWRSRPLGHCHCSSTIDLRTERTGGPKREKNHVCEPAHTLRIGSSTIFPLRLSEARVMTGPEHRPSRTFAAAFASFGLEGGSDEA